MSLTLTALNTNVCSLQSDVVGLKADLNNINTNLQQLSNNVIAINNQIKEDVQLALLKISEGLTALVTQVNELKEKNKESQKQITEINDRVNNLEQQMINKNIEIRNVQNKETSASDLIKTIAATVSVEVTDADIVNAYRLKRSNDKMIVEFTSLSKKKELMSKIKNHRVDANVINNKSNNYTNNDNNKSFIYVNDHLTPHNRRILWLSKKKALDTNWKFVWVRNGSIFAKEHESSTAFVIKNINDIELIA